MGRRLDGLLGRGFRASKFKALAKLAISRVLILKNQHQSRYLHAHSDVIQLLNLGHHERALQRIEYVIKERMMLDSFVMIEHYCHLLIERIKLLQNNKECPGELKEAILSLVYASSRCGEFPELQEIRGVFTTRFGEEFAHRAVEVPNKCGVNPKMIQKLSTRQSSMENRLEVLKEIAFENGVTLQLKEDASVSDKERLDVNHKLKGHESNELANQNNPKVADDTNNLCQEIEMKYKDLGAASQGAFESAGAAVEFSISEQEDNDADDHSGFIGQEDGDETSMSEIYVDADTTLQEVLSFNKNNSMDKFGSVSECEEMEENNHKAETERTLSDSCLESELDNLKKRISSYLSKLEVANDPNNLCEETAQDELLSDSKTEKKDVAATASQEASESEGYAKAAARPAVELLISELEDYDADDHSGVIGQEDSDETSKPEIYVDVVATLNEGLSFNKININPSLLAGEYQHTRQVNELADDDRPDK